MIHIEVEPLDDESSDRVTLLYVNIAVATTVISRSFDFLDELVEVTGSRLHG